MANIVRCCNCEYFFSARHSDVKRKIARRGAVGSALVGGLIGRHAAPATGGTTLAATVPAGIAAALMFGLSTAFGAAWALPLATCPRCNRHNGLLAPLRTGPRFTPESVARALSGQSGSAPERHSCSADEPAGFDERESVPAVEIPCSLDDLALEDTMREAVLQ